MTEIKQPRKLGLKWGEDILALTVFILLAIIPFFETLSRLFGGSGVPASPVLVQHLTLWIGFVGAILATRQNRLLALTTTPLFRPDEKFHAGRWLAKNVSFIVIIMLMWGSFQLVQIEFQFPYNITPNIPRWFVISIMPVGFGLMAIQIFNSSFSDRILRSIMLMMTILWMFIALSDAFNDNLFILIFGCLANSDFTYFTALQYLLVLEALPDSSSGVIIHQLLPFLPRLIELLFLHHFQQSRYLLLPVIYLLRVMLLHE